MIFKVFNGQKKDLVRCISIVALALWPNGPPCKWSGVEWMYFNKFYDV